MGRRAGALAGGLPDDLPPVLADAARDLTGHDELLGLLDDALVAEPPLLARDGGFIAPGYDAELDEARKLRDEGRSVIAAMFADFAGNDLARRFHPVARSCDSPQRANRKKVECDGTCGEEH